MAKLPTSLAKIGFMKRFVVKMAYRLFNWRSRRMIFLSSIYGLMTNNNEADYARTVQLTQVLNLARNPAALQFPIAIKSVIWSKRLPSGIMVDGKKFQVSDMARTDLKDGVHDALVDELLKKTPEWLHYARLSQMRYDLECLFKLLQSTKTA